MSGSRPPIVYYRRVRLGRPHVEASGPALRLVAPVTFERAEREPFTAIIELPASLAGSLDASANAFLPAVALAAAALGEGVVVEGAVDARLLEGVRALTAGAVAYAVGSTRDVAASAGGRLALRSAGASLDRYAAETAPSSVVHVEGLDGDGDAALDAAADDAERLGAPLVRAATNIDRLLGPLAADADRRDAVLAAVALALGRGTALALGPDAADDAGRPWQHLATSATRFALEASPPAAQASEPGSSSTPAATPPNDGGTEPGSRPRTPPRLIVVGGDDPATGFDATRHAALAIGDRVVPAATVTAGWDPIDLPLRPLRADAERCRRALRDASERPCPWALVEIGANAHHALAAAAFEAWGAGAVLVQTEAPDDDAAATARELLRGSQVRLIPDLGEGLRAGQVLAALLEGAVPLQVVTPREHARLLRSLPAPLASALLAVAPDAPLPPLADLDLDARRAALAAHVLTGSAERDLAGV